MRSTTLLTASLACTLWMGLGACESIANLDDVRITQGGAGGGGDAEIDSEIDSADVGQPDVADGADAFDALDVPDADASDAPIGDGGDGGPYSFPPTCVKPGSVMIQCDPMTNAGCGTGTACDMAQNSGQYGFVCFPNGTVDEGQPCNGVSGPWCKATLHCGTGTCGKFCCTSADCGGTTPQCGMYDPAKVGTFGWCQ